MYPTLESTVGNTPLVRLLRIPRQTSNVILGKLEGNNPAGSVKDRPALSMIVEAEKRGDIKPGDTLIEPTSGNTGIALAMVAAIKGYRMILVMPDNLSVERRQAMRAYGAELILTPKSGGMEYARDFAATMRDEGKGVILDQFANPDNPLAHYRGTGPEIWRDTGGKVTHFVSAMGTTGTIMGVSRLFSEHQHDQIARVMLAGNDGDDVVERRRLAGGLSRTAQVRGQPDEGRTSKLRHQQAAQRRAASTRPTASTGQAGARPAKIVATTTIHHQADHHITTRR